MPRQRTADLGDVRLEEAHLQLSRLVELERRLLLGDLTDRPRDVDFADPRDDTDGGSDVRCACGSF